MSVRAREDQHSDIGVRLLLDEADHVARERGDADVKQEAHRHVVRAEIDADHRTDLEIDEQEQQVLDRRMAFLDHGVEGGAGRPDGRAADREQAEKMKSVGQKQPDRIEGGQHPLVGGRREDLGVDHAAALPSAPDRLRPLATNSRSNSECGGPRPTKATRERPISAIVQPRLPVAQSSPCSSRSLPQKTSPSSVTRQGAPMIPSSAARAHSAFRSALFASLSARPRTSRDRGRASPARPRSPRGRRSAGPRRTRRQ